MDLLIGSLTRGELSKLYLPEIKTIATFMKIANHNKKKDEIIDAISKALYQIITKSLNGFPFSSQSTSQDLNYVLTNSHLHAIFLQFQIAARTHNFIASAANQPTFVPVQKDFYPPMGNFVSYSKPGMIPSTNNNLLVTQAKSLDSKSCLCGIEIQSESDGVLTCINSCCRRKVHTACAKIKYGIEEAKIYECIDCLLKRSDPLHEILSVLKCPLKLNNTSIEVFIPKDMYQMILTNENIGLEIRCMRLEEKSIEPTWPYQGELHLNGRKEFELKPLASNSSLKKRRDEKYFTQRVNLGMNNLYIKYYPGQHSQKSPDTETYFIGIFVVKKLQPEELITKIKQNNKREIEDCKKRVIDQFKNSGIEIDKLGYALTCVLDMQPLQTPAKGKYCKHANCFSLENFVNVWHKNPQRKWQCPICKIKAFDIVVDTYFQEILQTAEELGVLNSEFPEVTFTSDGEYTFTGKEKELQKRLKDKKERVPIAENRTISSKKPEQTVTIVLDDSEGEISKEDLNESKRNERIGLVEPLKSNMAHSTPEEILYTNYNRSETEYVTKVNPNQQDTSGMVCDNLLANTNHQGEQQAQDKQQIGLELTSKQGKLKSDTSSVMDIEILSGVEIIQENHNTKGKNDLRPSQDKFSNIQNTEHLQYEIEKEALDRRLEVMPIEVEGSPSNKTQEEMPRKEGNHLVMQQQLNGKNELELIFSEAEQNLNDLLKYSDKDCILLKFDDFAASNAMAMKQNKNHSLTTKKKLVKLFQRYFKTKKSKEKKSDSEQILRKTISKSKEPIQLNRDEKEKLKKKKYESEVVRDISMTTTEVRSHESPGTSLDLSGKKTEGDIFLNVNNVKHKKGIFSDPICLD